MFTSKAVVIGFVLADVIWCVTSTGYRAVLNEKECGSTTSPCFQCLSCKNIVLTREQICDGKFDCKDLSDEFLCPDKRLKYDSRLQYTLASLNIGVDHLNQDSAIELTRRMCIPKCILTEHSAACKYCQPGEIMCSPLGDAVGSSACVKKANICDGKIDCPNEEDENFCGQLGIKTEKIKLHNNPTVSNLSQTTIAPNSVDESNARDDVKITNQVAKKIQDLENTRIRCDVVDPFVRVQPRLKSRRSLRLWSGKGGYKSRPNDFYLSKHQSKSPEFMSGGHFAYRFKEQFAQNLEDNHSNFSVLFNWVSHSRKGEPAPLQKYIIRYLNGNENTSNDFVYPPNEFVPKGVEVVLFSKLCDGVVDCGSFSDEILCPGKFYCENRKPFYIDKMRVMDGVADCNDSSDEWPLARGHYSLASRYNLIGNWTLQILVWIMAVTALAGNVLVISCTLVELVKLNRFATASTIMKQKNSPLKEAVTGGMVARLSKMFVPGVVSSRRQIRVNGRVGSHRQLVKTWNSVLVLNLATADLLMGIYLMWLAVMSALYEGVNNTEQQYWTFDREWRTSKTCNALGTILLISSQTSVFTLVALTTIRLYTLIKPFATYQLKYRYLFGVCSLTWICSLFLAIIPLLPGLNEYFINAAFVPFPQFHPPDVNQTVADSLVRGVAYITNRTITDNQEEYDNLLSWKRMHEFIKIAAPRHSNWRFYGYYSEDSVCMPKLFVNPAKDGCWGHAATLITLNLLAVVYIAAAYIFIYFKSTSVQRPKSKPRSILDYDSNKLGPDQEAAVVKNTEKPFWCPNSDIVTHQKKETKHRVGGNLRQKCRISKGRLHRCYHRNTTKHKRNSTSEMQRRIALLIATDCVCWVPICIMGYISMAGCTIPDTWYAITAIGLLPINSALNPLVYSRFMRSLWSRGWSSMRRFKSSYTSSHVTGMRTSFKSKSKLSRPKLSDISATASTTATPVSVYL